MQISSRGLCFVSIAAGLLFLASCAGPESTGTAPAPVISPTTSTLSKQPPKGMPAQSLTITIQPGQSLGRIAEHYHVSKRAIIAANQLPPPYELKAGSRLVIPGAGANTATVAPRPKAVKSASTKTTKAKLPTASEPEVIPLD